MSEMNWFLLLLGGMSLLVLIAIIIGEWGVEKSSKSNLQIAKKIKKKCRYAKILIDIELPDYKKMWGGRSKVKVDLIVIHGVNVYVLHFVNVEGYVYGHEATKIWWCVHKSKIKFMNPMEISYMESEIVKGIISEGTEIIPIVVFPDGTNLNYINVIANDIKIIYESQVVEYICSKKANVSKRNTQKLYTILQNAN
ncbi:TPA: NERD domain-containing protein [Enterococcus faecium]|uniref:NERD domain-containing protein n=4 Tax=Enterococcus TaxID=1350 RepID=A0A286KCA1_ENTAV|nr:MULTISPECIES: nuclease-related domain-containing protein [Enterococcus]EOH41957.1 hypothetical protein SSI_03013 [Enterococcus faecium EnGen0191]APB62448.1 hypothetical protein pEMA120_p37 [Enterococcus faecium]APB62544.1 hypothetical protein pEA19081_p48 [Enterococcus avium]EOF89261.1 hypothetical protein SKG_02717 [Enterococcus faecium EnGen0166]EOM17972.1 hypothetical protein SSM_03085 [Enterococcus faecium EnGen0192]